MIKSPELTKFPGIVNQPSMVMVSRPVQGKPLQPTALSVLFSNDRDAQR
jgi:hypothetical protein